MKEINSRQQNHFVRSEPVKVSEDYASKPEKQAKFTLPSDEADELTEKIESSLKIYETKEPSKLLCNKLDSEQRFSRLTPDEITRFQEPEPIERLR